MVEHAAMTDKARRPSRPAGSPSRERRARARTCAGHGQRSGGPTSMLGGRRPSSSQRRAVEGRLDGPAVGLQLGAQRVGGGEVLGGAGGVERGAPCRTSSRHVAAGDQPRPSASAISSAAATRPPRRRSPASNAALARRTVSNSSAVARRRVEVVVHHLAEVVEHGRRRARRDARARRCARRTRRARRALAGGVDVVLGRSAPGCGSATAAAASDTRAGRSCSSRSSRLRHVAEALRHLLALGVDDEAVVHPVVGERLPSATAWARSFSWCGNRRSGRRSGGRSPRRAGRGSSRRTRCANRAGRRPTATATTARPAWTSFHSTKSAGWRFCSAPNTSRSPPPASMSSSTGGRAGRSRARSRPTGTRRRR